MTQSTCAVTTLTLLGLLLMACDRSSISGKENISPASITSKVETQVPTAPPPPPVVIETASPDSAVKSWWRVLDLKEKLDTEQCTKNKLKEKPAYIAYFPQIAQEEVLRTLTPKENACLEAVHERDIQEVKTESETRAVVFAKIKNVTPIPAGAEPDEFDKKYRKDGFRFKYLVEKTSEGWKVSQVYKYQEVNLILKTDPWEKVYAARDKPRYPAYVYSQ